jgi:PadR family transcriptional regulator PadR
MERKGWLASRWESGEGKRELKYYRLTAQGKKQLAVEESKWDLVVRAIARVPAPVES